MANTNVVSFNDAVLQRQRSSSANSSAKSAANENDFQRVIVSLDDKGTKQLVGQETI